MKGLSPSRTARAGHPYGYQQGRRRRFGRGSRKVNRPHTAPLFSRDRRLPCVPFDLSFVSAFYVYLRTPFRHLTLPAPVLAYITPPPRSRALDPSLALASGSYSFSSANPQIYGHCPLSPSCFFIPLTAHLLNSAILEVHLFYYGRAPTYPSHRQSDAAGCTTRSRRDNPR
ncbi:hypothetical protein DFH94DRAFT_311351 [Russula ochroleuca]|jgi:hypothetical protein|uniref:Uncharacterized protein n=1 Tax=Russula ochroleuca TaxID=152965 RepID=A0A9P5N110_9AGAM|nr:hypothetical protein DFH94DRAFT_311351 [Russula ochroleuca]